MPRDTPQPKPKPKAKTRGAVGCNYRMGQSASVAFCNKGVWEIDNGKEALAAGEVPRGRATAMCVATKSAIRHQTSDFYGPSLPNHEPPSPQPLDYALHHPPPPGPCSHQILCRKPPLDPPTPPPTVGCFPAPPPPKEKRRHGKNQPPRLETNCTPVVDSVCDNFNLISILVV